MKAIFSPAIALLNRLSYTKKFTLLWLVSLGAIAVLVYSLFASLDRVIQPSLRQLQGIELIKPISKTIQLLQVHRGLSAALPGGNEVIRNMYAANKKQVADAFKALEVMLPPTLRSNKDFLHIQIDFDSIEASWGKLQKEDKNLKIEERFAAYTDLIRDLMLFKLAVADEYSLTLDSEISTFYLIDTIVNKLPDAIEQFGQLRAYGTGILAEKQISEDHKIKMSTLIAGSDSVLMSLNANLAKVAYYNPELERSILAVSRNIADSAQQATSLAKSDILTGRFSVTPDHYFKMVTVAIDKSYMEMYESLLPITEMLIKQRMDKAKDTLRTSVGTAVLLFLLVIYFSASMYYAIIGSIQLLARSARSFAGGDMRARVNLGTRDELSHVGNSFNEMADSFAAMLGARREDEARLRATIETAMDAVVQMDSAGKIIGWNNQAEAIFGWSQKEVIGRALHETIIPPQHREAHLQGMERFLRTGAGIILNSRVEFVGLHRDGYEIPVELAVTPILMADRYEFNAFIRDITKKKESDELIWKQANIDTLTGLPNRHMFYDRLAQDIKKAHRAGQEIALLFIDLDKFKEVNDTLGHGMGDILLVEAASRISSCVRNTDTVARLGGDEFVVILTELDDSSSAERVAENILRKLADSFLLGHEVAYISASIGITLYPNDATEIEGLLKNADQAMYTAKDKGRNRFSYFTQSMQQTAQTRLRLINDLRGALAGNQFRLYYQPIMDMTTGRVNKAEALIRWLHPALGLISPDKFIPLAEETGMIIPIGDWVFKEAVQQLKHWKALYDPKFQISVNMSPVQFRDADILCKEWVVYLREQGLPEQSMTMEITEGVLLEAESGITDCLLAFREAGIQVAIDDFGTGYSSLSYLKKFDIDYLKIDKSFVRNLATDPDDMALSEAIIVMAHKLGLKVIAEGVETESQYNLLEKAGCDFAQGYYFSMSVPPKEFETFF